MAGRKVLDRNEAEALIAHAEGDVVRLAQLAKAAGIDGRSIMAWSLNLNRHDKTKVRLIELVPMTQVKQRAPWVLRHGPFALEVPHDFDEEGLRRLLAVLSAC